MAFKKVTYVEPADYIPKDLRKKYKVGEYAEPETDTKKAETKKATVKKASAKADTKKK